MKLLSKLAKDQRGVGAIEYALVASLISVAALASYQQLGGKVQNQYTNVNNSVSGKL